MEATVGGSGGIPLDPSLETGRDEEKNLKKLRLRFIQIGEMQGRDWNKHKKRRTSEEYFSRRLEFMNKERVKEKICNSITLWRCTRILIS